MSSLTRYPIVWQISKVENHAPKGLQKITFYQVKYNDKTDFVDFESGEMYADYYQYNTEATEEISDSKQNRCELNTSTNIIKIGGGYKTITATLFDIDGIEIPVDEYSDEPNWEFLIDSEIISDTELISFIQTTDLNKVKVKFNGNKTYINKELLITCSIGDATGTLSLNINSM